MEDLRRLADRFQAILIEVFCLLKALDAGTLVPAPLHDHAKTGDMTDCGKIVVVVEGEAEHRIVSAMPVRGTSRSARSSPCRTAPALSPTCWAVCAWAGSTIRSAHLMPNGASPESGSCVTGDLKRGPQAPAHHARIDGTADGVWKEVANWGSISDWFPMITESRIQDDGACFLRLGDGAALEDGEGALAIYSVDIKPDELAETFDPAVKDAIEGLKELAEQR